MASMIGNIIYQQANNPGTGTFNLLATPSGRNAWVGALGTGNQAYYFANDGTSWEVGIGTVTTGSPETLSRDTVLGNSLGTTAKISFTGLVTLTNDVPGQRTIYAGPDNTAVVIGGRKLSGLVAGAAVDDAPRLDQVAWQELGTFSISGSVIVVPLSGAYLAFRLNCRVLVGSSHAVMYLRISTDGGATYHNASTDYVFQASAQAGTNTYPSSNSTSYFQITGDNTTGFGAKSDIQYDRVAGIIDAQSVNYDSTVGLSICRFAGYPNFSGAPTHMVIGAVAAPLTSGTVRLEGRV